MTHISRALVNNRISRFNSKLYVFNMGPNRNKKLSSAESREIPKTVLHYLRDKHSTIINDYLTPDGRYSEHCGLIAIDVAKLLLDSGRQPYIAVATEDVYEGVLNYTKTLAPTIYEGRVTWGAHQVCCCNGKAFDPILEAPVSIEDYTKTVFGEHIKMEVWIPHEQIEAIINR